MRPAPTDEVSGRIRPRASVSPGAALPGSYLLFALDSAAVPSRARTVSVG